MEKYIVTITTSFKKDIVVEAKNEEEAIALIEQQVENGDIEPTDTLDFETYYGAEEEYC